MARDTTTPSSARCIFAALSASKRNGGVEDPGTEKTPARCRRDKSEQADREERAKHVRRAQHTVSLRTATPRLLVHRKRGRRVCKGPAEKR